MRALSVVILCIALSGCRTTSVSTQGRVVSSGGAPVDGASVTLSRFRPPGGLDSLTSTTTNLDGAFDLSYGPIRCGVIGCPALFVIVEKSGYKTSSIYVPSSSVPADALATVRLERPGSQ